MRFYLDKIEKKESLSYLAFLKKCEKQGITDMKLRMIFSISPSSKRNQYILSIKDEDLFNKTFSKFLIKDEDLKVEAALHGNSKTVKSDKALLIWKENFDSLNSVGIEFNESNYKLDKSKKNKLIIIENLNNFLNIKSNFNNEIDLDEYNFVWGSGNSITNKYFSSFLNEYNEIICFFDIDLGGLKFYKSLKKQTDTNLSFFFSDDMKKNVEIFGTQINFDIYSKVLKNYSTVEGLEDIIAFIKEHKKFAEQEIFQHNE
tara:strand:- start:18459 stop:19235 length:777 start_codon:yes stop_codon:yes gene_type:complete